jgi:hypothetical protein
VLNEVRDNGAGIAEPERIIEPLFTIKADGMAPPTPPTPTSRHPAAFRARRPEAAALPHVGLSAVLTGKTTMRGSTKFNAHTTAPSGGFGPQGIAPV